LANCHFELKNYDKALFFIGQALTIDPKNDDASNSKKFFLLAFANEKKMAMDFVGSMKKTD